MRILPLTSNFTQGLGVPIPTFPPVYAIPPVTLDQREVPPTRLLRSFTSLTSVFQRLAESGSPVATFERGVQAADTMIYPVTKIKEVISASRE
jgi:hypothetical protein